MERDTNAIEAEAIGWVVRRDAGSLSAHEQAQLDTWLAADPRHHGAFIRADTHWVDLERWAAHRRRSGSAKPESSGVSRMRRALAASIAAISIAFAGAATWYLERDAGEMYASAVGEVRNIELPDGSRLTLNTNTVATVQFEGRQREVSLVRGEALFEVARDVNRPFVVVANDVQIKAIGTAFTVRVDNGRTDVLVTEGTVEVSRQTATGREVRRVSAQQRAMLASPASRADIEPMQPAAIRQKLAWREGKAVFVGEPLSAAAAEMNRHSRHQLHVDDLALAGRRVIGVFNANDAAAFANAVAATFGAEVRQEEDGIHLRPAAAPR